MRKSKSSRAILILESPWQLDDADSNRSSVTPFIEGIAKLAGDTEVFYANFYDLPSFRKAFECLCKVKYDNTIVYVAAHGSSNSIGSANIEKCLEEVARHSREFNITGIMLGSCYVGGKADAIINNIHDSNLKWCVGYKAATYWLPSTMIDCSILSHLIELNDNDFSNKAKIISTLEDAMSPFDRKYLIGTDKNNRNITLSNSMEFYIQPDGQGYKAKSVTKEILQ